MAYTGGIEIQSNKVKKTLSSYVSPSEKILLCIQDDRSDKSDPYIAGQMSNQWLTTLIGLPPVEEENAIVALENRLLIIHSINSLSIEYGDITAIELFETRHRVSLGLYVSTLNYPLPQNTNDIYDVHSYKDYPAHIYLAKSARQEVQSAINYLRDLVIRWKNPSAYETQSTKSDDMVAQLEKLSKLFQNGTLTKEEFELAKKKLLKS